MNGNRLDVVATHRRLRRVVAVGAVGLSLAVATAGCNRGDGGRDAARAEFVDQLVGGGLAADQAECIADKFFAVRTNDELNEFFDREELTAEERAEFAALTEECSAETP